jgi:2-amino-4-hydroxy-6-hydroxymethyldihydropteridine diphosphokinase
MRAGIALGSNLGDRLAALQLARASVLKIEGVGGPLLSSHLYETEPVDSTLDAGAFYNAVIEVGFHGDPLHLLRSLQNIEAEMGRPQNRPLNAPRVADLDILYLGDLVLASAELAVPHPRMHLRRFVLQPLADIRPGLLLPGQTKTVATLLAELADPAAVFPAPLQWPAP